MSQHLQTLATTAVGVAGIIIIWWIIYGISIARDVRILNKEVPLDNLPFPGNMKNLWSILIANYGGGIKIRIFTFLKRTWLPYATICAAVEPTRGPVIDVGCGEGILIHMLSLMHPDIDMTGLDIDEKRLEVGRNASAAGGRDLAFISSSADQFDFSGAGTVMATESMHHMDMEVHEEVLSRIYDGLCDGGRLLLFEIDKAPTYAWLSIAIADLLLYGEASNFRSRREWIDMLHRLGFKVGMRHFLTSFGRLFLFVCEKLESESTAD